MKKKIVASVVLVLLVGANLFANEQGISLEKIVVTPYRIEIPAESSGLSTESVYTQEMARKGISSLKNALIESSSIVEASSGSLGGDTSIFLRGHNSNHTRFMLDGIKIYDPIITTAYYNFTHFNLQGIDKIEISKGPQSSLYGSDAIGGVINLFSKKGEGKPKFNFAQTLGSYNTYIESAEFSGAREKLSYCLGITKADVGGYSLAKEKNNYHERDPYHNFNASLKLDYDVSEKTKLGLISRYIYAKYEYDGSSWSPPYLPVDDDDNYAYDYEGILGLNLKQSITDNFDYKLILAQTSLYRKGWEDATSDNWYYAKTYQADNQFKLGLSDYDKIIFGFDYLRELGDSFRVDSGFVSDFPKETANNKGYFLENIFNPGNLFVTVSYRIDDHSTFNDKDTYRIASSYEFEGIETKLKASFGTGFKAPSIYQLYAPQTAWGPIGNSSLQPEESESYELGIENRILEGLGIEVNYFHSQLKNLVDFDNTLGYINVGKSRIKGIESGLDYRLNKFLDFGLYYTWMDTENKDNHAELARRPANKVVFKLKAGFDRLTADFYISYIGHRLSDTAGTQLLKSYTLGNLALNYKINKNLDIFSRFENILDDKYEEITGYQTPKFSTFAGIKLSF
ncbi:MAG: TonB-dependent receptor [Candidatus Omnitrophica bacterium]|nr:TonB-dependent receptor [Candidatus Omnitrophota bacterium]